MTVVDFVIEVIDMIVGIAIMKRLIELIRVIEIEETAVLIGSNGTKLIQNGEVVLLVVTGRTVSVNVDPRKELVIIIIQ